MTGEELGKQPAFPSRYPSVGDSLGLTKLELATFLAMLGMVTNPTDKVNCASYALSTAKSVLDVLAKEMTK